MNTIKLTQINLGPLAGWLREHIAQFTVTRTTRYESPARARAVEQLQVGDVAREEQLFRQAVQENSNLELDWLWCAANVTRVAEQRYCLLRALEINPDSEPGRRALAKLPAEVIDETVALAGLPGA